MCWGDVKLKETADGKEYLEFNERQTKTRMSKNMMSKNIAMI